MATLFNTKISATYPGLIKTFDNIAINATLKQLTDGSGNTSGLYMNTAGDFKVTSVLEWGSLKDTGSGVVITQFVTAANGIQNFANDTTIPTSNAVKTYVDAVVTASDLDFKGDSGTGEVDLDSQILEIAGTTNEITTVALNQKLTIGLPNSVTISGTYTGATFLGDLNGTINTATTATTQSAGTSNSTVATTKFVMDLDSGSDLDFSGDSGTGDVTLNTQVLTVTGTTNQIVTAAANQGLSLSLPSTVHRNLQGNVTGNVDGNLTGNVTATSVLLNGVSATTQSSSDSSTKIATTAFVKGLNNASDLDFTTDSGSGAVVLNTETFSVLGTTNQINSAGTGQAITLSLPTTIHRNLLGNVTGALTGNADTATKWQTARNLSLTGQATGILSNVDGTLSVSGAVTLDNNSVTAKKLTGLPTPAALTVFATDSILEGIGKLQSQINGLANGLQFQGTWDVPSNDPVLASGGGEADSGTTTATTANKLIDTTAGQNFLTTVSVDDKVINRVDGQTALVTNVDSDTSLSLSADIMLINEAYTIDKSPFIEQGYYYVVSVGGTRTLNGITNWSVGDWVIAGATNVWEKLDHTDVEGTGTGTANTGNIARWSGPGTIVDSIMAEASSTITVSGSLITTGNLSANGDLAVNTNKFTAQAATGNVAFAGNLAINTNKLTVNATSGNLTASGNIQSGNTVTVLDNSPTLFVGKNTNGIAGSELLSIQAYGSSDTLYNEIVMSRGAGATGTIEFITRKTGGIDISSQINSTGDFRCNNQFLASNDNVAYSFTTDIDTGFTKLGLNKVGIITGGTTALTLDSDQDASFAGSGTFGDAVRINGTTTTGLVIASATGSSNGLKLYNNSSTDNAYIYNHFGGNLEIGTNNATVLTMTGTSSTFAGDLTIDNSSPEFYLTPDSAKYSWMIAAQENVDQHFEITPSTTVGGTTFNAPALKINGANSDATFAGNVGIGIAPDSKLRIANNDGSSYRFGFAGTSDVYLDADDVYFRSDNGNVNNITFNGGSASFTGMLDIVGSRSTFVNNAEDDSATSHIFTTDANVGDFAQLAGSLVLQARVNDAIYRDIILAGGLGTAANPVVPILTVKGEGAVFVNGSLNVSAGSTFTNMITVDIDDISTGENRGVRIINSSGVDQQWNITVGVTGEENDSFCIRNSTDNSNALVINRSGLSKFAGAANFVGQVKINNSLSALGKLAIKSTSGAGTFYNNIQCVPSDATTGGLFLGSNVTNDAVMTAGSYYFNAGQHKATATTSSTILFSNGSTIFKNDTGLTVDSNFTPTQRMRIDTGGSISVGAFGPSGTPTNDYRSLEIGRQGNTVTGSPFKSALYLSTNATITAGSTAFTYRNSNVPATKLIMEGSDLIFENAPAVSGTGAIIDFTERFKVDSTGRIQSTAGIYLGTNNNVNLLDSYQEGTWTPEIYYQNSTDQANATNSTQTGRYTKIGNTVFVQYRLIWTITGTPATDNCGIKNFPFNGAVDSNPFAQIPTTIKGYTNPSTGGRGFLTLTLPGANSDKAIFEDSNFVGNMGGVIGAGTQEVRFAFTYTTDS